MDKPCTISYAYDIAVRDLQSCYEDFGIVAGRHHYGDYWTRDAGFAWLAALELGNTEVVWRHVVFLSRLQRTNGMVPFLIRRHLSPFSMLGIKIKIRPHPKFRSHKALFLSQVIDSNPWFAIGIDGLFESSIETTRLSGFFLRAYSALKWCLRQVRSNGLVREGFLAGWNDGILKSGATLLNNALFYRAFDLWRDYDPKFAAAADRIKEALQRDFFNGRYFIDWIDRRGRRRDYFESLGNFLAVLWGVADEYQAQSIVDFAFAHAFNPQDKLVKISYPGYPASLAEPSNRIVGLGEYGDGGMYWLEPALLFVRALTKIGRNHEALQLLEDVAALICKYQGFYEVYEQVKNPDKGIETLKPVNRWNYRSEHPFARSSGLFILTCRELGCV